MNPIEYYIIILLDLSVDKVYKEDNERSGIRLPYDVQTRTKHHMICCILISNDYNNYYKNNENFLFILVLNFIRCLKRLENVADSNNASIILFYNTKQRKLVKYNNIGRKEE